MGRPDNVAAKLVGTEKATTPPSEATEVERTQRLASRRARQQAALADLGLLALARGDLDTLLEAAVVTVRDTLEVDLVKVLERTPDGRSLLLRAGAGWHDGLVGKAVVAVEVGGELTSQSGYTLRVDEPVIVEDLARETRFSGSSLLTDHGVVSGLSVIIRGQHESFGVLGAHTRHHRVFDRHEAAFLRSVANVLAMAVDRYHADLELQRANESLARRVAEATDELRLSNRRLGEQEAFLRSIYNEVGLAVYIIDVEADGFRYRDVNSTFEGMTGVDRSGVIGRRPEQLTHLSRVAVERTIGQYRRCVATGESIGYETYVPTPGGGAWWLVSINPVADAEGVVYRLIGTAVPITERKEAEEAIQASEERFRAVFEQGPSASFLLILDDRDIINVNSKGEEMLGYDESELTGRRLDEIDIWPDRETLDALEAFIAEEDDTRDHEVVITRRDGTPRTLRASLERIEFGGRDHLLLMFEDVTEQKQIETDLREARRRLVEVQEQERLALARELHDDVIQQLLSLNQALSRMLRTTQPDTDVIAQHRDEILALVGRLRRRISDLRPAGLEEFGLKTTLESFLAHLRSQHDDGPLLTSRLGKGVRGLTSEATRTLFRVAQEALRNALKHAGAGAIAVELEGRDGWVHLTVSDDGRGFEVPERLSSLVRDDHFGLVGLEERLSLLGGSLDIVATPGRGTTVRASIRTDTADEVARG